MVRNRPARLLLLAALLPALSAVAQTQEAKPADAATAAANEAAAAAAAEAATDAAAAATRAAQPASAPAASPAADSAPPATGPATGPAASAPAEAKPAAPPVSESKPAAKPVASKPAAEAAKANPGLRGVIAGSWRDPKNVARDGYRHPLETLTFFGLKPDQTVVEITPGGGWYSEILAPYLSDKGRYVAAVVDPDTQTQDGSRKYFAKAKTSLEEKFAASPAQYGKVVIAPYDAYKPAFGPAGSADVVLTFRNVHNWRSAGQAEVMFKGFFDVLKPGGVLGVVEHRAKGDVPADDKSGYVGQAQVIAMAEAAGFRLDAKSEVNANPRDTKNYPNGVWTLPPVNRHDAADAAKYQAIGESDRMTLRFRKPR